MSGLVSSAQESLRHKMQDWLVRYGFVAVTIILFVWFLISEETFRQPSTLFSMLSSPRWLPSWDSA
jgi:simple sugar transport system permease protein